MKVMVTGATGFVGQHVVDSLLERGNEVIAVARDIKRAGEMPWIDRVKFIQCDLHDNFSQLLERDNLPDVLVHLAWSGLPNYDSFIHISKNLHADLTFLEAAVKSGVSHLAVAGTCLEYGMQSGPLSEDMETSPTTSYGFAKDTLRKSLQLLQKEVPFTLQWMRMFYVYGKGQNCNSLISKFNQAIDEGKPSFNMSKGDQLRDYLPIEEAAEYFSIALENPDCHGVINCCSGKPISVFDLVMKQRTLRASSIVLNRGVYRCPPYEPVAFWGIPTKLHLIHTSQKTAEVYRARVESLLKVPLLSVVRG
jgi:dTDP-6-deoxy-L-talose 4-dehydrogenase (NAD+)